MIKEIALLLFLFTPFLFSAGASQEQLNSIYQEALLFVAIFGTMGIISYFYSTRHAKEYVAKEATPEELEAASYVEKRVQNLKKLLDEKRLTKDEFSILSSHYKA